MKRFILSALLIATHVQAEVKFEFDEKMEVNCHREIEKLGCTTSKGEESKVCVESKKGQLTSVCRKLHEEKKKNS